MTCIAARDMDVGVVITFFHPRNHVTFRCNLTSAHRATSCNLRRFTIAVRAPEDVD